MLFDRCNDFLSKDLSNLTGISGGLYTFYKKTGSFLQLQPLHIELYWLIVPWLNSPGNTNVKVMFPFNSRNGLHIGTVKCKEYKVMDSERAGEGEILVHYDKQEAQKSAQDLTKP